MRRSPIVGLFLAAGRGTRFAAAHGNHADKLIAPLKNGVRVIDAALAAFLPAVDECVAVVEHAQSPALAALRDAGVRTILAPDAALGMGHSLAAAAREAHYRFPNLCGVVVALADMPWIARATIDQVITGIRTARAPCIVRPRFNGHAGHPVGFTSAFLPALAGAVGDAGARDIVRANADALRWCDVDDRYCMADVDLPSDIDTTFDAPRG